MLTYSNPGFTTFDLDYYAENIKLHYLNMAWYYAFKSVTYLTFDFANDFGIDIFTVDKVRNYHDYLKSSPLETLNFMRKANGYPFYMMPIAYALHFLEGYATLDFDYTNFICSFSTFGMEAF